MTDKTFYEVLGVTEDASKEEIKAAFKRLAKKYHPDVTTINKKEAERIFKELSTAYTVLSRSDERLTYDQSLKYGGFKSRPQPCYERIYLAYLDAYDWIPCFRRDWNEHHDVMYG
jgi:curved DNA-binding protein CbpA